MRDELGGPCDAADFEPTGHKILAAMLGEHLLNQGLVRLRRSSGKGERYLSKTEIEQAVAAARLAVVVTLRGGAGEDFDLPIVQAEAAIDRRNLRFDRALIRQEQPGRTALDDGGRDR